MATYTLSTGVDSHATHGATGTVTSSGGHNHTITMKRTNKEGNTTNTVWSYNENFVGNGSVTSSWNGAHTHTVSVSVQATGGNQPHENRQPFSVINRWKRMA